MTIREILNRLFWDSRQRKEDFEIVFIHRGASMNQRRVPCKQVKSIQSSRFTYVDERGEETVIPYHRILLIRNMKTGELIWRKRGKTASDP